MKVLLNYAVELNDIPTTIGDLLGNLSRQLEKTQEILADSIGQTYDNSITEALSTIDTLRQDLSKIDQSLMDYSSILAGYVKTAADINSGIDPTAPQEIEENVEPQTND
jgi:Mg2+ and Co2+ transporter CorA